MKVFTDIRALEDYNSFLADHLKKHIDRCDLDQDFDYQFGGHVHVATTVEDAEKIFKENEYYDIAEDINDSWHMLVVINNNSGGPTYFIPRDILEELDPIIAD